MRGAITFIVFGAAVFLFIFLIVAGISFGNEDKPDVGYSIDGTTVTMWNKNSVYFFDRISGIQWTEDPVDYWTKNNLCVGYYSGGKWNKIKCVDELGDFNADISTDNLTYVNATLWKDFSYSGYDMRFAVNYYIGADSSKLKVTMFLKNIGIDIPYDIGLAWNVTDINLNNNSDDRIVINDTRYHLQEELDLTFRNMTKECCSTDNDNITTCEFTKLPHYKIEDKTKTHITLEWDGNLNYAVKLHAEENQENSYVSLMVNAGQFSSGQSKSTIMYWQDPVSSELVPTADGATLDWACTGDDCGTGHYAVIDEGTTQDITDYISEDSVNDIDIVTLQVANVHTVFWVNVSVYGSDQMGGNAWRISPNGTVWETVYNANYGAGNAWDERNWTGLTWKVDGTLTLYMEFKFSGGVSTYIYTVVVDMEYNATSAPDVTPPEIDWAYNTTQNDTLMINHTYIAWNTSSNEDLGVCIFGINGTNQTGTIVNGTTAATCRYNETGLSGNVTRCADVWVADNSDNWNATNMTVCMNTDWQPLNNTPPDMSWDATVPANNTALTENQTYIPWKFASEELLGNDGCEIEINGTNKSSNTGMNTNVLIPLPLTTDNVTYDADTGVTDEANAFDNDIDTYATIPRYWGEGGTENSMNFSIDNSSNRVLIRVGGGFGSVVVEGWDYAQKNWAVLGNFSIPSNVRRNYWINITSSAYSNTSNYTNMRVKWENGSGAYDAYIHEIYQTKECFYNETGLTGNVTRCATGYANDSSGNLNNTEFRCLNTDEQQGNITAPSIEWIPPTTENGTLTNQTNQSYIIWNASFAEDIASCKFQINGTNQSGTILNYTADSYCYYNETGLILNQTRCIDVYAADTDMNWNITNMTLCINTNYQQTPPSAFQAYRYTSFAWLLGLVFLVPFIMLSFKIKEEVNVN